MLPGMAIEITAADVTAAEEFLAAVVSDRVPEGRFTDGTALRDLCIKALAVVSAQHRKDNATTQSLQSLLRIKQLARTTNDPAVDDAADAILSNVFFTRTPGQYARGTVNVFVSRKQDYVISRTAPFPYDRNLIFYVDSAADVVVPAQDVKPITDGSGRVFGYSFTQRVIAAKSGSQYNVSPAVWAGTGGFSPYITRVTSSYRFEGGTARQSTLSAIDAAEDAMAVRNLINGKSVRATLSQNFPAATRVLVVGMGEPEMMRDSTTELATGVSMHVGGHFDVYADMPVAQTTFTSTIGGRFMRPDRAVCVFGDTGVSDWTVTPVRIGDVIRVSAGLTDVPRDYAVREIRETEVYVSERYGFPETADGVTYYIYRPLYGSDVQIYPATGTRTTGYTAATVQTENRIVLPAEPHYDIIDVAIIDPDPADPNVNDPDGAIHFFQRTDETPTIVGTDPNQFAFRVHGHYPVDGQSARAFDEIEFPAGYDGKTARVTYFTLAGFAALDGYLRDRFERVLCANVQLKARHPVYVSVSVPYALSPLARTGVDELALRQGIVTLINTFNSDDVMDVSDISTYVKNFSSAIGTVFSFGIAYTLFAPDGSMYGFTTDDVVAIPEATLSALLAMGVSDRTIRYQTRLELVQLEPR